MSKKVKKSEQTKKSLAAIDEIEEVVDLERAHEILKEYFFRAFGAMSEAAYLASYKKIGKNQ
jgi:hypothetical protein